MSAKLKLADAVVARPNVVAALQDALDDARAGKVLAVAIAFVDTAERTHTSYANDSARTGKRDLVAGVALLQHRLLTSWNDG